MGPKEKRARSLSASGVFLHCGGRPFYRADRCSRSVFAFVGCIWIFRGRAAQLWSGVCTELRSRSSEIQLRADYTPQVCRIGGYRNRQRRWIYGHFGQGKVGNMGAESGGGGGGDGGDASPPVKNLGGDVPSRFDNETAQIRCLFRFSGRFGIGWPPADDSSPLHSKIRSDAPGGKSHCDVENRNVRRYSLLLISSWSS